LNYEGLIKQGRTGALVFSAYHYSIIVREVRSSEVCQIQSLPQVPGLRH